ncbi:MAG: alpha-galactosidase, partial [Clostridia bacterium]|nr:alpha-galactosidase [Clostridia bacterium]
MSIRFIKEKQRFIINTRHTTYAFDIVLGRYLYHTYYGRKAGVLPDPVFRVLSFAPYLDGYSEAQSTDVFPQECSFYGSGDFRPNALRLSADGTGVSDFVYRSYRIFAGRAPLDGLPAARADEKTRTLEITLSDEVSGCILKLYYTVFSDVDVISRYMIVENKGKKQVNIDKCMSLMLDLRRSDLDMISLYGSHCCEVNFQRTPLHHGTQSIYSKRGATSHQYNPFLALCDHGATEEKGGVYGFNFVYSGSFLNEVDVDQIGQTRVLMGLGSDCFSWQLQPGDSFCSPEAIMTYTPHGLGSMTRNLHRFVREHILPTAAKQPHPVVLNTWEACFFDIDQDKLIRFAKEARKTGFDMLVMDDGWFGQRNHDRAGLGDWYENPAKFPDGLASFVEKIQSNGIKFGI